MDVPVVNVWLNNIIISRSTLVSRISITRPIDMYCCCRLYLMLSYTHRKDTVGRQSVCCCCPSLFWGYITLCTSCTALDGMSLKWLLPSALFTLQLTCVWGLARLWCLVKFCYVLLKMFYVSSVLFLIAVVRIPCTPRILWANARLTTCAFHFRRPSLVTWASNSTCSCVYMSYCADGR